MQQLGCDLIGKVQSHRCPQISSILSILFSRVTLSYLLSLVLGEDSIPSPYVSLLNLYVGPDLSHISGFQITVMLN